MNSVYAAKNGTSADWLLRPGDVWSDLVRYGPSVFDTYIRVPLVDDHLERTESVRRALDLLTEFTRTPDDGYAAVWEGWTSGGIVPTAPVVDIPNRRMLLFQGHVRDLHAAPTDGWHIDGNDVEPHLAWPGDNAWCIACDVDEEVEFTVGCTSSAAAALMQRLPGTRAIAYGEDLTLSEHP